MSQTKLANLINPEVLADMISAELPSKLKFAPLATVDSTLMGQPGDSITIPSFDYIGEAEDLTEGIEMGTVVLTTQTKNVTIKEAGIAVEITDKAVNSGYGNPVGEANNQIIMSIQDKVDSDSVVALEGASLELDKSTEPISYVNIVDAVDLFQEEDDEPRILFIHPKQKTAIRKDPEFLANVDNAFVTGAIGEIAGCQVVASNKVPNSAGVYTNFIVKPGALAIYMKAKANIEADRNIRARSTTLAASEYYVAALADDSKVVKLKCK